MSYYSKKFEWTAFTEADLLAQGASGTSVNCGDTFTMPATATVTMSTYDDDNSLSGDGSYWSDDQASDWTGQKATIDGARVGDQMYAEQYHVLCGSDGKTYYLIEIEVECHDAPGTGNGYFTFYGATPPAGVELTVTQTCNVSGSWVDYSCLGAGPTAPPNTPPTFTNVPEDGIFCVTENNTFVIDLNATDADGDTVSYEIVGGADAHLFEIDATTGELTFKSSPDYEAPTDANCDNIYDVTVKVKDGKGGSEVKPLWVKVTDDTTEVETGCIAGRFFVDADCNNSEWNEETCAWDEGICGAEIKLLDTAGNVVATTTTDGYGRYSFEVPAGDYRVQFPSQDGKNFAKQDQGLDLSFDQAECNDSNANTTGLTDVIHVTAGATTTSNPAQFNVDAGVNDCPIVIGTNCMVIEAEDMTLTNFCINNASSASDGQYVSSYNGCTGSASTTFTGDSGKCDITITAWDAPSNSWWSSTSEKIWLYVNGVCVKGPIYLTNDNCDWTDIKIKDVMLNPGDTITIYAAGANGTSGIIDKIEICCEVIDPKTGKIGDKVFLDLDKDGIQDADEAGVAGVTVLLKDADGNVLATTTTDANGNYLFDNLPAGDYQVSFVPNGDAANYVFTTANQGGDDALDSDVNADGDTGVITLGAGEENLTVDAGLKDPGTASIAGRIFMDANDNDVDDGEMGVAGVTVTLLDGAGNTVATTTTGADGSYLFDGLDAGDYVVQFPTEVDGKVLVNSNAGGDDTVDSDADQTTGQTGTINLNIGDAVTDVDAGIEDPGTAKIGDKVFIDANRNGVQDAGEVGLAGVAVALLNATGDTVATTTTDADGMYLFDGLDAGDYRVDFTAPDDFVFTAANAGVDDALDSDANPTTGQTGLYNLSIGEANLTVDAGVRATDPVAQNDSGMVCANEDLTLDVLNNDSDIAGRTLTITSVGGQAITEGNTVTVGGVHVTLQNGKLVFDGETAYQGLNIGESASQTFSYTIGNGLGGEATADAVVKFCGVAETLAEICESLPETISYKVAEGRHSSITSPADWQNFAYDVALSGSGDARLDGLVITAAYCLDPADPTGSAVTLADAPLHTANLYCATPDDLPATVFGAEQVGSNGETALENLDLINYILNQDYSADNGYTDYEVQSAIWALTSDYSYAGILSAFPHMGNASNVEAIINDAVANGENFVAGPGGVVGLIIDPSPATDDNQQPYILGVDFNSLDCLC